MSVNDERHLSLPTKREMKMMEGMNPTEFSSPLNTCDIGKGTMNCWSQMSMRGTRLQMNNANAKHGSPQTQAIAAGIHTRDECRGEGCDTSTFHVAKKPTMDTDPLMNLAYAGMSDRADGRTPSAWKKRS